MNRWISAALAATALVGSAALAFLLWPAQLDPVSHDPSRPVDPALVARGAYLTRAADCVACHTLPGGRPFTGGRPFELPFGTIYAPNITPDRETGLGKWSAAEFVRALRRGVGRHGEDLYPAFPYTSYALLTDDDALAIFTYLKTLAPVRAVARANAIVFPFDQRPLLRAWKLLFVPSRSFAPDPGRSDEWNRGAYLARALAHCGECHTPRNLLFGRKHGEEFAGAVVDGWKAYNITSDPSAGIGAWTDEALRAYLSTGYAKDHGGASGSMGEAVDLSLRHLDPSDIAALAAYLRSVPPRPTALSGPVGSTTPALAAPGPWSPPHDERETLGSRIFAGSCASCHGWDGTGQEVSAAALRGARTVNDPAGANLVRVILAGSSIASVNGNMFMPAFHASFSDAEVAAVATYVLRHFGGKDSTISPSTVAAAR